MVHELLKNAREGRGWSMDQLVLEFHKRFNTKLSKQNYARYEQPNTMDRPNMLLLEALFELLEIDKSRLPHYKDRGKSTREKELEKELAETKEKYLKALEDNVRLSNRLIAGFQSN